MNELFIKLAETFGYGTMGAITGISLALGFIGLWILLQSVIKKPIKPKKGYLFFIPYLSGDTHFRWYPLTDLYVHNIEERIQRAIRVRLESDQFMNVINPQIIRVRLTRTETQKLPHAFIGIDLLYKGSGDNAENWLYCVKDQNQTYSPMFALIQVDIVRNDAI